MNKNISFPNVLSVPHMPNQNGCDEPESKGISPQPVPSPPLIVRVVETLSKALFSRELSNVQGPSHNPIHIPKPPPSMDGLKDAAKKGSLEAQVKIFDFYVQHKCDRADVERWWNAAAQAESPFARICAAEQEGATRVISDRESVKWYVLAMQHGSTQAEKRLRKYARLGNAEAYYQLGMHHADLWHKDRSQLDADQALKRFLHAACRKHKLAQYAVSQCYQGGIGAAQSQAKADKWMRRYKQPDKATHFTASQ